MTTKRFYVVAPKLMENGHIEHRLIEATSQSQALRFVAEQAYAVHAATTQDVARLMGAGVKIESAGTE